MNQKMPNQIGGIEGGIFTRHSTSARHKAEKPGDEISPEHKSLTVGGVEKAQETARKDLVGIIDKAPEGAVLFVGGKSDQARTGETGEVYGEELKQISGGREDLFVLTKQDIEHMRSKTDDSRDSGKVLDKIKEAINQNSGKKVVITFPLWLKELSYAYDNRWVDSKTKKKTDYFDEIVKKYDGNHAPAARDWIENQGRLELADGRVLLGPNPEKVAKEYLRGLSRLQEFAEKQIPGRPVIVHGVGHQWDLDAVVTLLAQGKVDIESFDKTSGGTVINESEVISNITISPDGKTSVDYRGKSFEFDNNKK